MKTHTALTSGMHTLDYANAVKAGTRQPIEGATNKRIYYQAVDAFGRRRGGWPDLTVRLTGIAPCGTDVELGLIINFGERRLKVVSE